MSNEREQWGSKIGFVMAAAGSAVGLGNIWKFPYLAGVNGGAAFVFVYLLIVLFIGFTVMLAEFAIGRASRKNAVGAFAVLSKNPLWQIVGWAGVSCGFVILSYYGVVAGWAIKYMIVSFTDLIPIAASEGGAGKYFGAFIGDAKEVIIYQVLFMIITILIVAGGIGAGIERACKIMMPALFIILIILIVRAVTLPGAEKGIEFYLKPDFSKINAKTILAALGQVFFSLSLGMGCMITYGSYFKREENLPNSALAVVSMDTLIAFLAGLAIFPAVFALGGEPGAGPGLTFVTLPGVFAQMTGGMFFCFAFFLLLFFAAVTSSISLLEVVVSYFKDELGWSRVSAAWILGLVITALGVPSAMSLGGDVQIFNMGFMDAMEFLSDKILMPLGGIFIALFAGWMMNDKVEKEVTSDGLVRFGYYNIWLLLTRVIAPIAMAIIFVTGLLDYFGG
jgi:NSS family neurotransmitter:Na+ symporter